MRREISRIVKVLSAIENIKAVILYGSFARGDYSSRSDIDLFILTAKKGDIRDIEDKIIELENQIGRNIQPTIRTTKELQNTDTGLLQNIFQEGKVIYLKEQTELPSAMLLKQKPYLIYSFQISKLSQNEKAKFNSELYGRVKGKHKYKGVLEEVGGQKLSSGCIIIPYTAKQVIEKFLKKYKAKFSWVKVWR